MTGLGFHGTLQQFPPACAGEWREVIDRLLIGREPALRTVERLHGHLAGCGACRRYYNRVVLAGRLLHGGRAALAQPSRAEFERIKRRVFARTRLAPDPTSWRRYLGAGRALAVGAAAALSLTLVVTLFQRQHASEPPAVSRAEGERFATRGAAGLAAKARFGLRVICAAGTELEPRLRELGGKAEGCPRGAMLKFAYTSGAGVVDILAVDAGWRVRRVAEIAVSREVVDEPAAGAALPLTAPLGPLRVFGVWRSSTVASLDLGAVQRALGPLGERDPRELAALERLPVALGAAPVQLEQRSLLLEVVAP